MPHSVSTHMRTLTLFFSGNPFYPTKLLPRLFHIQNVDTYKKVLSINTFQLTNKYLTQTRTHTHVHTHAHTHTHQKNTSNICSIIKKTAMGLKNEYENKNEFAN